MAGVWFQINFKTETVRWHFRTSQDGGINWFLAIDNPLANFLD
jgi:hypothetical protein